MKLLPTILVAYGVACSVPAPLSAQVPTDALDLAIASTDRVYVWYKDGTVSSGSSAALDRYSPPRPFTVPPGKQLSDIVGIGIAKNDHVYAWYDDGTVSSGTSEDLDKYQTPHAYTLPPGKTIAQILGIAIAGSNDHVYVWYDDGTVSSGTSQDLDAYHAPYAYSLPPDRTPSDILGIGIAHSNDHVYAWFKDGTVSSGTSGDLDAYLAPYSYRQHLLIRAEWGPEQGFYQAPEGLAQPALEAIGDDSGAASGVRPAPKRPTARPSRRIVLDPSALEGIATLAEAVAADQSPSPTAVPFTPGIEGVDPMVAVGRNFLIVSQQGEVGFFDRDGNQLGSKHGEKTRLGAGELFGAFLDAAAVTDINRYAGFPKPCDDPSYPNTRNGRKFCIAEVYDVRVTFDAVGDRFIVYANMRNAIWTDAFRKSFSARQTCGSYDPSWTTGDEVDIGWSTAPGNWCLLARRQVAVAVSKTEDPRDGFRLYALTENNYRDFPWATINGDAFVLANKGQEMPDGPVATVLSLSALRNGAQRPPYFRYYKADVNDHARVLLPVHHGSPQGLTLMIGGSGGNEIRVFGFPPPSAPYVKPPLYSTVVKVKPMWNGVYRNGFLYFAESHDTELSPNATTRFNIRVVRFPVWAEAAGSGWALKTSLDPAQGYRARSFGKNGPGDAPGDIVSYEEPTLDVNKDGDVLIAYGRYPVVTQNPLYPEVRYTVWYHNEPTQRGSKVLMKGEAAMSTSPAAQMDYAWAVVDPVDDETVWIAHEYAATTGYRLVVGRVRP